MMEQLRDLKGHRGFTSLAISRFISNVGNGISPIALAYGVLSLDGADGKDLSIVMAARFVPLIGFMLFGGVIADRFQRNRLVGGADMIGSFLAAVSAISLIAGFSSVWLLATMGALFGILNAIWWPAMSGVLPEILPKEKLQSGNAIIGLTTNIGYIVGTLSGGILVATVGSGWGLLADAISFFIAGVIVWFLPIIGKVKDASPGILHDLIVGWREFISRSWVIAMVFAFSLINMAFESMLSVLGPLNFSDPETGPRLWSYNLAALTIGMLIGGIWVLKVKFKKPLFVSMILIAISSIWDFSLALDLPLVFGLIAGVFSGISLEVFMVTWMTSLQSHVPEESYSRVSSYDTLGSYGIAPLGIVAAGPLAMHFGVNTILFVTGVTTLVAACLSLFVKSVVIAPPKLRGWFHLAATPLVIIASLVLFILSGEPFKFAVALYSLTAIMLFSVSAIYHRVPWIPRKKKIWRRWDHANINLLIAGSYTPFAVALLEPTDRNILLSVIWIGALSGVAIRVFWVGAPRWLYVANYLILGWVAVIYTPQLYKEGGLWSPSPFTESR